MSYKDRYLFNQPNGALSTRMTSRKPLKSVKYTPFFEADKQDNGLIKKVTSKIGIMFQDIRSAVGSIFKSQEEEGFPMQEQPPKEGIYMKREREYPNLQQHPITEVDFTDLTHILSFQNQIRTEDTQGMHNINENQMEISFGGQNQNSGYGSGEQTSFSFQPRDSKNESEILQGSGLFGKISPGSSGMGKSRRKEK